MNPLGACNIYLYIVNLNGSILGVLSSHEVKVAPSPAICFCGIRLPDQLFRSCLYYFVSMDGIFFCEKKD